VLGGLGEALNAFRKLTPVPLLAVGFAATVILFSPDPLAGILGIDQFRNSYRFWIGMAFVVSWCYLAAHSIWWGIGKFNAWNQKRRNKRIREKALQELTPQEKKCLRRYIHDNKNTCCFDCTNGVVGGLQAKGILFRSSSLVEINRIPYNLQGWARKHLREHPQLLEDGHADMTKTM